MDSGVFRVFRVREYRFLWLTDLSSIAGDQFARVALAVLVYGQTGSALVAAAVYALTYVPALFGGVLLGWVADRYRRREVMASINLTRFVLMGIMALPGLPLPVLCVLLSASVMVGAPFSASQNALLPQILPDELYESGIAVRQMTLQTAHILGFAAGGVLVATLNPYAALLINSLSFLLAAVLVRFGLADRPPPGPDDSDPDQARGTAASSTDDREAAGPSTPVDSAPPQAVTAAAAGAVAADPDAGRRGTGGRRLPDALSGIPIIWNDPRRRALVALVWTIGWYSVPEGLAVSYAAEIGVGTVALGLLMAADPIGSVLGAWLFVRFVPFAVRERVMGLVAVAAGAVLILTVLRPGVPLTMLLWGLSGMLATAYLLQTQASFVRATPDRVRGRAIAVASAGIVAGQGIAMFIAGVFAEFWDVASAIALAGAIGAVLAGLAALSWWRTSAGARAEARSVAVSFD